MIINSKNLEMDESLKEKYSEMVKFIFTLQGEKEVVFYHAVASYFARKYLNIKTWSGENKSISRDEIKDAFTRPLYRLNEDFIFNVEKCVKLIESYCEMFLNTMYHEWVPDEFEKETEPVFFMNAWGFNKAISSEDYVKLNKYAKDYIKATYYVGWGLKFLKSFIGPISRIKGN